MNHRNSIQSLLGRKCPPSSRHAAVVAGCNSSAPSHRAAAFQIGTTGVRTTQSGAPVGRSVYTAFGEPVYPNGQLTRYGYAGAWGYEAPSGNACTAGGEQTPCDPLAELGWLHVGARYYDPAAGRFMQRDPIGIRGGLNTFLYSRNNPVDHVDPTGLKIWTEITGGSSYIDQHDDGSADYVEVAIWTVFDDQGTSQAGAKITGFGIICGVSALLAPEFSLPAYILIGGSWYGTVFGGLAAAQPPGVIGQGQFEIWRQPIY